MSETRKAGSEEFKQELAEASKDPEYEARLKLSSDPETAKARAAKVGDKYDVSGYSDKEISMALQGDEFLDEDYARLTGKSAGGGEEVETTSPVDGDPADTNPIDEVDIGEPTGPEKPGVPADEFLSVHQQSFNAKGGTLSNSGNITSKVMSSWITPSPIPIRLIALLLMDIASIGDLKI